jgi:hypothetical protein
VTVSQRALVVALTERRQRPTDAHSSLNGRRAELADARIVARIGTGPFGAVYLAARDDGPRIRVEVVDDPAAVREVVHASALGPALLEPFHGALLAEVAPDGAKLPAADAVALVASFARHVVVNGAHGDLGPTTVALRPDGFSLLGGGRVSAPLGADALALALVLLSLTLGQPVPVAAPSDADARRWVFRLRFALAGEHVDVADEIAKSLLGAPDARPLPADLAAVLGAAAERLGGDAARALATLCACPITPLPPGDDPAVGSALGLAPAQAPKPAEAAPVAPRPAAAPSLPPPDPSDFDAVFSAPPPPAIAAPAPVPPPPPAEPPARVAAAPVAQPAPTPEAAAPAPASSPVEPAAAAPVKPAAPPAAKPAQRRAADQGPSMVPWLVTLAAIVVLGTGAFAALMAVGVGVTATSSPTPAVKTTAAAPAAPRAPQPEVAAIATAPTDDGEAAVEAAAELPADGVATAPSPTGPVATGSSTGAAPGASAPAAPKAPKARPTAASEDDPWGIGGAAPTLEVTTSAGAGTFKVKGDAVDVRLISGARSYGAGDVPAGTYTVQATFDASTPSSAAGTATVTAGGEVTVTCKAKTKDCSVK